VIIDNVIFRIMQTNWPRLTKYQIRKVNCYHSALVMSFSLSQSYHIKWLNILFIIIMAEYFHCQLTYLQLIRLVLCTIGPCKEREFCSL
jgi:hypothetical protein